MATELRDAGYPLALLKSAHRTLWPPCSASSPDGFVCPGQQLQRERATAGEIRIRICLQAGERAEGVCVWEAVVQDEVGLRWVARQRLTATLLASLLLVCASPLIFRALSLEVSHSRSSTDSDRLWNGPTTSGRGVVVGRKGF